MIAINGEDIRFGDVIRTSDGVRGRVIECRGYKRALNKLEFLLDSMRAEPQRIGVLEIVELCHRPRPQGVPTSELFMEVGRAAQKFTTELSLASLDALRQSQDTFELATTHPITGKRDSDSYDLAILLAALRRGEHPKA